MTEMGQESKKPSNQKAFEKGFWSEKEVKKTYLKEAKQYVWNKDYFERTLLPLFALKEDSTVVDVGCGLGFFTEMLSVYVPKGKVLGIDLDMKLVDEAQKRVDTLRGREALEFRTGDAYNLPLPNDFADLTICQTLLMHLSDPAKAINEMKRITKSGGTVCAIERDYTGITSFDTGTEKLCLPLEKRLLMRRAEMFINEGKRRLGRGDNEIGSKVPILFHRNGLQILDVRVIDRVLWLIPPYTSHELELKQYTAPPEIWIKQLGIQDHFMAGGGTEEIWDKYHVLMQELFDIQRQQIEDASFVSVAMVPGTITIARRP